MNSSFDVAIDTAGHDHDVTYICRGIELFQLTSTWYH